MRVALVVQRYGVEVGGGAETLARLIAELLRDDVDADGRSRRARSTTSPGPTTIRRARTRSNGVRVLRFPVPRPRDVAAFDRMSARAYAAAARSRARPRRGWSRRARVAPELVEHLRERGSRVRRGRLHDLPLRDDGVRAPARRRPLGARADASTTSRRCGCAIFDEVFARARALVFSTPEEQELAAAAVRRAATERCAPDRRRRRRAAADRPAAVRRGARRQASLRALRRAPRPVEGRRRAGRAPPRATATRPRTASTSCSSAAASSTARGAPWLHVTGFVSEQEKHDAIAGATVVVVPSPYESLSLALLEAWAHGRPTLANADSPVLVGQSRRSGGGLWYRDGAEYAVMLDLLARVAPARGRDRPPGATPHVRDVQLAARARALARRAGSPHEDRLAQPDRHRARVRQARRLLNRLRPRAGGERKVVAAGGKHADRDATRRVRAGRNVE